MENMETWTSVTGWWLTYPLKNMKVSWDDEILNIWKTRKCSKPPTRIISDDLGVPQFGYGKKVPLDALISQCHRQSPVVVLPSGKRLHNYGKSPFLLGKLTIPMAIFNSYVTNYQRVVFMTSTDGSNNLPLRTWKVIPFADDSPNPPIS